MSPDTNPQHTYCYIGVVKSKTPKAQNQSSIKIYLMWQSWVVWYGLLFRAQSTSVWSALNWLSLSSLRGSVGREVPVSHHYSPLCCIWSWVGRSTLYSETIWFGWEFFFTQAHWDSNILIISLPCLLARFKNYRYKVFYSSTWRSVWFLEICH